MQPSAPKLVATFEAIYAQTEEFANLMREGGPFDREADEILNEMTAIFDAVLAGTATSNLEILRAAMGALKVLQIRMGKYKDEMVKYRRSQGGA